MTSERQQDQEVVERMRRENLGRVDAGGCAHPVIAAVSEKIEPVAWAMTDYQPEANTQYTGDKYAAEHWGSQGIQIEPLYPATTVSALEARIEELRMAISQYRAAYEAVQGNPAMLLSDPDSGLKCAESMQSLEMARLSLFAQTGVAK